MASEFDEKKYAIDTSRVVVEEAGLEAGSSSVPIQNADDALLAELGYKSEFRRQITVRADEYSPQIDIQY